MHFLVRHFSGRYSGARNNCLPRRLKSLRSRKSYARKSRRAYEESQSISVGISNVALTQQVHVPSPSEVENIGAGDDRRSPLKATTWSQVVSSGQSVQASTVPRSIDSELALSHGQSEHTLNISNGVGSLNSDRAQLTKVSIPTEINHTLARTYFETYLECAYSWCPTLDQELLKNHPEFASSTLLNHSIAVVGTNLKPPFVQHNPPIEHYQMARQTFYTHHESNQLITICAIMLFHYWDMTVMNTVNNTDTDWWWLGNAIRLAQEEGLHREGKSNDSSGPFQSLKRRIWWTLFVSTCLYEIFDFDC